MGCQNSKLLKVAAGEQNKQMADFLSPEELELIRHNWSLIEPQMSTTGIYLFTKLFEQQEGFKKVFKRLMNQTETGQYEIDWTLLGYHADLVMGTLKKAVPMMDESIVLSSELRQLGERHCSYGVMTEMLALMWPALRDSLKQALGPEFTLEAELAWKHMFDFITSKMAYGISTASKSTKPPSSTTTHKLPMS